MNEPESTALTLRKLLKKRLKELLTQQAILKKDIDTTVKMIFSLDGKEAAKEARSSKNGQKHVKPVDSTHTKVIDIAVQLRHQTGKPFLAKEVWRAVSETGLVLAGKKSKVSVVSGFLSREVNRTNPRLKRVGEKGEGLYDVME